MGDLGTKARKNLRAELSEELVQTVEVGRKIAEMTEAVNLRLFGPQPTPERSKATPPVSPDAPIESIFIDGIRCVKGTQEETAATLQDILNRL